MVCRPLEQKRLMVMPLADTGRPARSAIWRAMLPPVAPSGVAQPMMTSSTSAPSMPARSTAAWTAKPPSVAPWVMLKAPFQLLASGVRAVGPGVRRDDAQEKVLPSAARRASSGAGCQNVALSWGFFANCFIAATTLKSPWVSA